jgi:hypothetical protein
MGLRRICELFVPEEDETDLLRACLLNGSAGAESLRLWVSTPERAISTVHAAGGAKRRLLPLLQRKLQGTNVAVAPELRSLLHAAQMYERLRSGAFRDIVRDVLRELQRAEILFLALRGFYFASEIYGADTYRHCHDIDLLIAPGSLTGAAQVLVERCECRLSVVDIGKWRPEENPRGLLLFHASGLPIALHEEPFVHGGYQLSWRKLWERATVVHAYGTECHALSPEDSLLQLIVHASTVANSRSLMWLCDAWLLIERGGIDWEQLRLRVSGAMVLPCVIAFEYLEGSLGAEVPHQFLDALRRQAEQQTPPERRHAEALMILGLQRALPGGRKQILRRAAGLRQRLSLLRMLLLPPVSVLVAMGSVASDREALGFWLRRLWRGLTRQRRGSQVV